MRGLVLLTVLASLAAGSDPANAQVDPCAGGLDPARIIDCLRPGGISSTIRGIRPSAALVAVAPSGAVVPGRAAMSPPVTSSVDLSVTFGFDSAELTPQGATVLSALGTALQDPALAGAKLRVAGHTDAKGSDGYNETLSLRRAEAARRFLVEQGGVDPARLSAIGFGRRQLYDAANPGAAANRWVQVIRFEN